MCKREVMSDQDAFTILAETAEQYRDYGDIHDLLAFSETTVVEDYSMRDMSHPLGIAWQGRVNGVVE